MLFSEKLKLIRKTNNMTQADLAASLGVSRGNIANIELGNVAPTTLMINCVSLMYNIDKNWLMDDTNDDLSPLYSSSNISSVIAEKYKQLDDQYKIFVENQILQLLEIQNAKQEKPPSNKQPKDPSE